MSLHETEHAVLSVCFGREPSDAQLSQLGDRRVWLLYRDMVRDRLRKEIHLALARSCRAAGEDITERLFVSHLDRDPPRTRFFREVVGAFAASAVPALRADPSVPSFVADLMEYETACWLVTDLDARVTTPLVELAFDRPVVLSGALVLLHLQHAVHKRPAQDGTYERAELFLGVHRRGDDDKPRTWVFDRPTFASLQIWQSSSTSITDATGRVAAQQGFAVDAAYVDRLCTALAELIEAGIVLGCS